MCIYTPYISNYLSDLQSIWDSLQAAVQDHPQDPITHYRALEMCGNDLAEAHKFAEAKLVLERARALALEAETAAGQGVGGHVFAIGDKVHTKQNYSPDFQVILRNLLNWIGVNMRVCTRVCCILCYLCMSILYLCMFFSRSSSFVFFFRFQSYYTMTISGINADDTVDFSYVGAPTVEMNVATADIIKYASFHFP